MITRILLLAFVLMCMSLIVSANDASLDNTQLSSPAVHSAEERAAHVNLLELEEQRDQQEEAREQKEELEDQMEEVADQHAAMADAALLQVEGETQQEIFPGASAHHALTPPAAPIVPHVAPKPFYETHPAAAAKDQEDRANAARYHLKKLAHDQHVAAYNKYKRDHQRYIYNRRIEESRQSERHERELHDTNVLPHPESNAATFNGDRNFNTLFPAATAKSDGKAPSQNYDFQHAGNGDLYMGHGNILAEQSSEVTTTTESSSASSTESESTQAPCSLQCDKEGGWKTSACQDCIVRGMVNGWIVKSVVEKQPGYNYVHWSRNKCVRYANEIALRKGNNVKGAPFSSCFFQQIHESCNL